MSDLPPPPPPPPSFTPPPGYVAYGDTGSYARIAKLTQAVSAISIVAAVVSLVSLVVQWGLRSDAAAYIIDQALPKDQQSFDFKSKLSSYTNVGAVSGAVSIAALVLGCVWAFRIAKNIGAMNRPGQSFRPGASVAAYVIGGCTLGIVPFLMWREFWRGSDPQATTFDNSWKKAPYTSLITLHFAFSLAAEVLGLTAGALATIGTVSKNSTLDVAKTLHNHFPAVAGAGVLQIAALLIFAVFARQLGARHMQATGEA